MNLSEKKNGNFTEKKKETRVDNRPKDSVGERPSRERVLQRRTRRRRKKQSSRIESASFARPSNRRLTLLVLFNCARARESGIAGLHRNSSGFEEKIEIKRFPRQCLVGWTSSRALLCELLSCKSTRAEFGVAYNSLYSTKMLIFFKYVKTLSMSFFN